MVTWLKAVFLNRKALVALAVVGAIFFGGWYVNGTLKENEQLLQQIEQLQEEKTQRVIELERTIDSYDNLMSVYVNAAAQSVEQNEELNHKLENLENETLAECMSTPTDAEFLNSVFQYPRDR